MWTSASLSSSPPLPIPSPTTTPNTPNLGVSVTISDEPKTPALTTPQAPEPPLILSCPFNCTSCLQPHTFVPHLLTRHTIELQALAAVLESLTLNCYNSHRCCFSHTPPDGCAILASDWWTHIRAVHLLDALATTLLILTTASDAWLTATTKFMSASAISARAARAPPMPTATSTTSSTPSPPQPLAAPSRPAQVAFAQGRSDHEKEKLFGKQATMSNTFWLDDDSRGAVASHISCPQPRCPSKLPTKLKLLAHVISHVRLNSYATQNADGRIHGFDDSGHDIRTNVAGRGDPSRAGSPSSSVRTPSPNESRARAKQQPLPGPLRPVSASDYSSSRESPNQRLRRAVGTAAAGAFPRNISCPYPKCTVMFASTAEIEHHAVEAHSAQLALAAHALAWAAQRNKLTKGWVCPLHCLIPAALNSTGSSSISSGGSSTIGMRRGGGTQSPLRVQSSAQEQHTNAQEHPSTPPPVAPASALHAARSTSSNPSLNTATNSVQFSAATASPTSPGFHAGGSTSVVTTHSLHACGADAPVGQVARVTGDPRGPDGFLQGASGEHLAEHPHHAELEQHIQIYHPGPMVVMAGFVSGLCAVLAPSEQCPFCTVPKSQDRELQYSSCFRGSALMGTHMLEQHPKQLLQVRV